MKKSQPLFFSSLLLLIFVYACISSGKFNQTPGEKKFSLLPVQLNIKGAEKDTTLPGQIKDAFSRYKVQLIAQDEMKLKLEEEGKRIGQKVYTKDADFKNTEDALRRLSREHRYIVNILTIDFELLPKDDSLYIFKVGWSNMPFPPDFSRTSFVGTKYRNIDLTNLSYSVRENVISIVDSILYSKELK